MLALALAGCSRPVDVVLPGRADAPACQAAAGRWPASVSGMGRVTTSVASASVAAWGEPALVARCGVASPGPTTDDCLTVNGVDWVATALTDGTRFVTYGRTPAIEVLVPRAYAPEGSLLPAFAAAAGALPATGRHCS